MSLGSIVSLGTNTISAILAATPNSVAVVNAAEEGLRKMLLAEQTPAGAAIAFSTMIGMNTLEVANASGLGLAEVLVSSSSGAGPLSEVTQQLAEILILPNLNGIPISSPQVTTTKTVDVSQNAYIVPNSKSRELRIDNTMPRPRRWQIAGYLKTLSVLSWLDAGSIMKHSILLQSKLINMFMDSRLPVWFKTNTGEFVQVIVTNYTENWKAEYMTALEISIELQEYKALEFSTKLEKGGVSVKVGGDK